MIIRGHTTLIEKKRQAREPRSTAQTWKQSVIATLVKAPKFGKASSNPADCGFGFFFVFLLFVRVCVCVCLFAFLESVLQM